MDREKALQFIQEHYDTIFYQPVIFEPHILEIRGKWNESTKRLADIILTDIEGKSILDVGCNIGFFLREAKRRGAIQAIGIDNDPAIIQLGRRIEGIDPYGIAFIEDDLLNAPAQTTFDIILMLNIFHMMDPTSIISQYKPLALEKIIIEHDKNIVCFSESITEVESPRAAGHRVVSVLQI